MDNRALIRKLAKDASIAEGARKIAERIQARAQAIDPDGDFVVVKDSVTIGTLKRTTYNVVNTAADAAKVEFGQSGAGESGRSGLRPLGRAARSVKSDQPVSQGRSVSKAGGRGRGQIPEGPRGGEVYVKGYTKKDGTRVEGYYRDA